jgi:hypothetical protein
VATELAPKVFLLHNQLPGYFTAWQHCSILLHTSETQSDSTDNAKWFIQFHDFKVNFSSQIFKPDAHVPSRMM